MKLLTTNVGWAATDKKLFWTTDGGDHWSDITPKVNHKTQKISSVFFLDPSTGWALLKCADDSDPVEDDICFDLASTTNAGNTWSPVHEGIVEPLSRKQLEDRPFFSGQSWLNFADAQHGWEILKIATGSGPPSAGKMLRTTDGGKTWAETKGLPMPDHFRFVTPNDGWIAGGENGELFVTHDAGDSWQKVVVPEPSGLGEHLPGYYGLPMFETAHRVFEWVQYTTGPSQGPNEEILALSGSEDGGKSWRQEAVSGGLPLVHYAEIFDRTLVAVNSQLVKEPEGGGQCATSRIALSLFTLTTNQATSHANGSVPVPDGVAQGLSFGSKERGWTLISGRLFGTQDGGRTWSETTPGGPPPQLPSVCAPVGASGTIGKNVLPGSTRLSLGPASGTSANVSAHLGFDISRVPCPTNNPCTTAQSLAVMQSWMTSSPFYDTSVYLPGSPNRGTDVALTKSWIIGTQQQGWGLIPIWFGPQPPCACYYVNNQCTRFSTVYSSDPSTDGAEAADAAVNAASQTLGLSASIIFADVENYYVSTLCTSAQQTAAGQAVQAYVDGFVSEMHLKGSLAGFYANPTPITKDISTAATKPDDIWVTKTPAAGSPPQITIWNQGIKDTLWPSSQRIHQYLIDQAGVTWGGTALKIDYDIDNAPVANANDGFKSFSSFTFSSFDYPGSTSTLAKGVNDMWDTNIINGTQEIGQIVGGYYDASGIEHGFLLNAFVQPSTIDYPGQYSGEAEAINNSGQIVGDWLDSSHCSHGYLYTPANLNPFVQIDNPSATCAAGGTGLTGINDAGQITRLYCGSSGCGSFLYYGGKYYSISYPGAAGTNVGGINGDAMVAGYVGGLNPNYTWVGFQASIVPSSNTWTGTYTSFIDAAGINTYGQGIDNNGDIAAYYEAAYLDDFGLLYPNGASFQYPTGNDTYATGVNDFGQIVGYYHDASHILHAFLAVRQ